MSEQLRLLHAEKQAWTLKTQALRVKIIKYRNILEACKPLVLDAIEARLRDEAEDKGKGGAEANDKNESELQTIKEKALAKCEELFLIEK
jgi:hypothetical protein